MPLVHPIRSATTVAGMSGVDANSLLIAGSNASTAEPRLSRSYFGRLHRAEGMSIKGIVRTLGVARNTVRSALRAEEAIACRVGVHVDVVSKWRKRFVFEGIDGLCDRPRTGRPRTFPDGAVAGVKAMACEPPKDRGVPMSRWSSHELAANAVSAGLVEAISSSTVRRWLHADAIKPWRYQSWIFPRDPNFAEKAARVLDLYARVFHGVVLGDDEYVISADEKSHSKRSAAVTRAFPPHRVGCHGSSSSTAAAAPSPTSPPTTFTGRT